MEKEIFVDVVGFEGLYKISNHGRIKTVEREIIKKSKLTGTHVWKIKEMIRKPSEHSSGYLRINLRKNKKCHFLYIHVLVMLAFKGEKPENHDVDHRDRNRHNNHLSNLRYLHQTKNRGIPGNQNWKGKSKSIINQ